MLDRLPNQFSNLCSSLISETRMTRLDFLEKGLGGWLHISRCQDLALPRGPDQVAVSPRELPLLQELLMKILHRLQERPEDLPLAPPPRDPSHQIKEFSPSL